MDHESLRTAATYLNNLLLARGLLRNAEPVDFVKPSKDSRAQIINLVHDLVLRQDREREAREHAAFALRGLRAEETRKDAEILKLRERDEELGRAVAQAKAAERTALAETKKVERMVKSVQEQAAKLKTSLAQVRTQCANDVRKRDLELARLKTHLQGQQRGNKVGMAAPGMTITGASKGRAGGGVDASVHDLGDPEYSLKQETTEFLTQLSQSLSDENDSLITLIRDALGSIKELLGVSAGQKHPDSAIGSLGSAEDGKHDGHMLHALPTSYETLSADMDTCIAQLKGILSNPNFVAIEEVEVREEEIARLREGWERMEQRWKDVLYMMESWRRKMDTGHTIDIEDLRKGMGLVSPERERKGRVGADAADPEQSFALSDVSEIRLPGIPEEGNSSVVLEPPRLSSPVAKSSPKRKRDVLEPPEFFDLRPAGRKSSPISAHHHQVNGEGESGDLLNEGEEDAAEPEARMTIEEKLSAAQAEAEEAAAAARAGEPPHVQRTKTRVSFGGLDGPADEEEQDDTLGKLASPMVRKTKIRGRPKRRKSTLSPEELEELMMSAEAA